MLVVENAFITVTGDLRHIESMAAILGQSLEPDYLLSGHVFMGPLPRQGCNSEKKKFPQNTSIILLSTNS